MNKLERWIAFLKEGSKKNWDLTRWRIELQNMNVLVLLWGFFSTLLFILQMYFPFSVPSNFIILPLGLLLIWIMLGYLIVIYYPKNIKRLEEAGE